MQLYNALTDRKESIKVSDDVLSIYVCGITPYDTTHLGHGFTYAIFDVLVRYLESLGQKVLYVQNVTDIDDDILRKARQEKKNWRELGDRWTRHFIDDNMALNLRPPDFFPKATDVISEIVENVEKLLAKGIGYESGGNVYFEVREDPDFGQLSRLSLDEMLPIANERGNYPDDPNKRDPLDFVLWQAAVEGEPSWESPWGEGRPGWHIECSTMSSKYLGLPVDIHGGGADLIFPHHECEIAQAEYAAGSKPFSRFWVHAAMVEYQGEKMSKSLGNLVMVRDLLNEGVSPDTIRVLFSRYHYREAWSYKEADLRDSAEIAHKLRAASRVEIAGSETAEEDYLSSTFKMAMDDDLNTPEALKILVQSADEILRTADEGRGSAGAQKQLIKQGRILGLQLMDQEPEGKVVSGWKRHRERFS